MDPQGECSKPKKSKSSFNESSFDGSQWACLPAVVLHHIFDLLSPEDRISASSVCQHWRRSLFHPKWWSTIKFKIDPYDIPKATFFTLTFGHNVSRATVILNSLSPICVTEFIFLLKLFNENNHLESLILQPSHCRLEEPLKSNRNQSYSSHTQEIIDTLIDVLPQLTQLSLGGLDDLAQYCDDLLRNLNPSKVTLLGLASIKEDITIHSENYFDVNLISPFRNLQILSIDYDRLSDVFLYNLREARNLRRLVVHLHGINESNEGASEEAWQDFSILHPDCLLRLNVIHAYSAIDSLHVDVLRTNMPLSHLKVFFCEDINLDVLSRLYRDYSNTLRSVMWIDSLSLPHNRSFKLLQDSGVDPFVMMAWTCQQFEEMVLYGYNYAEENLLGIGRLRGEKMRKLEIPINNVVVCEYGREGLAKDIAKCLDEAWRPKYRDDLHSVILDPIKGDSDEFLLPFVQADLV